MHEKIYLYTPNKKTTHMKNLIYILVLAVGFASCNMADKTADMKTASMKEHVQKFYDQVFNAHNVDMVDSFVTADFTDHNPDQGHSGKGIDDLKTSLKEFFAAFPDIHITPNFMVAEGDKITVHMTMTGTNSGAMMGMPATNKQVNVDGVDILTIKDGKATERWGYFDTMKFMMQMGMMPPPGTPPAPPSEPMKMEEKKK
jgi:steroid delta-isomerase-like uncharacterized protein